MPRSNANLPIAIRRQWLAADLDDLFTAGWGSGKQDKSLAFNDGEARPVDKHPRPYCVVEYGDPVRVHDSSGKTSDTVLSIFDITVDFQIWGSSRDQCKEFAEHVAGAYEKKRLTIETDGHLQTFRDNDICRRQEDKTWMHLLSFRFRLEGVYPAEYS